MNYEEVLKIFNDGISDTGILFILVLIDTILALTYCFKVKKPVLSGELLSGLLRNFLLCFMPIAVSYLAILRPRTDGIYALIACILTLFIAYAILQSILAYATLWGLNLPDWLKNIIEGEIKEKIGDFDTLKNPTSDKEKTDDKKND